MVSLDARPRPRPARADTGRDGTRTEWLVVTGAVAAALGAAVAMAVLSAVTVLLWAAGPIAGDGVSAAPFRGAAALWLMGQRAPLDTGTFELVLPPLAVTAVVVVLTARLAGWAARATSAFELTPAAVVGGGVVLGHVGVAGIAAWVSARNGSGVDVLDAMRSASMFAVPVTVAGIAPHTWLWAKAAARHGTRVRLVARTAGLGALALAAGSTLVLLTSLGVHHRSFTDLLDVVGGGISGGAGTLLLCLAMAPNAVLWVVALAAGPGFALGADSGLSLTGEMHGGALPAMPLLAALPGAGPLPGYAWVLVAVPIGAGAVIGWFARPAGGPRGWRDEVATAAVAGAVCGLGVGALAGLSGGGAGGRLADLGPNGLQVGLVLGVELAAAAAALAGARIGWEYYRGAAEAPEKTPAITAPVLPKQKSKDDAVQVPAAAPSAEPSAAEPPTATPPTATPPTATPISVVAADEVEDLPEVEEPADPAAKDLEDTQELAVGIDADDLTD